MCLVYVLLTLTILVFIYASYMYLNIGKDNDPTNPNSNTGKDVKEGFYPRRWWAGPRWGWRRNWLRPWGNWRPYGYYPAYSGFWKQCPSGDWIPQNLSCYPVYL